METRSTRRSNSNLSLAHLAMPPLSANPINAPPAADPYDRSPYHPSTAYVPGSSYIPSGAYYVPSTSYLTGKSAPSTPGILSRSASPVRHGSKSFTQLPLADTGPDAAALPKYKSAVTLTVQQPPRSKRKAQKGAKSAAPDVDTGEWLFRAGATIASQTQESKGQSWLVSRASSTSLAAAQQEGPLEYRDYEGGDGELGAVRRTYSTRAAKEYSRAASAVQSRVGSRMASRVNSRVGSRAELARLGALKSAADMSIVGKDGAGDYFVDEQAVGPDFVDRTEMEEEDDDEDTRGDEQAKRQDEEVARLASERGFGLGGVVDRIVGWSLFDVKEKGEKSDDEAENEDMSEAQKQEQLRKLVSERLQQSTVRDGKKREAGAVPTKGEGEEATGWQDAAWLMSVASKVLF